MWDLGNRDIIVLVSVISGWAILLNIFGPYFGFFVTLVVIACGWLTYIVADDTPFTPHANSFLDYLERASGEFNDYLTNAYQQFFIFIASINLYVRNFFRKYIFTSMAQNRRSTYQLSSESHGSARNSSSRFSLVDGLSPISRGNYRSIGNTSNMENNPYVDSKMRLPEKANSMGQVTSTPLLSWRKENSRNGDVFSNNHGINDRNLWRNSQSFGQNHTLSRGEESNYSPEGSPWGTSISPKMRPRAAGVKTVQTVAGPLLASTRYNIDPKLYSDVTSPGLTTRLTRYATEANTKLTHQSQYGTGQFPRVNLNTSPTPLINMKTGKMRMPVTVRVAPPENTRYSPPERQQIISDVCHVESKSSPSVVQVLREISLKRHASREDVTFELAKKQRTEGMFGDGLENLEEMTQKRTRDDSSRSEEDVSPQNKSLRPAKRSKMPSCHDILSSLSSSVNVSSGIKRKAVDVSRSSTPDVGKHFKSLDSSHGDVALSPQLSRSVSEPTKSNKRPLNEKEKINSELPRANKKSLESTNQTGIVKSTELDVKSVNNACGDSCRLDREISERDVAITRKKIITKSSSPVKLTDKLFMKAEPENIDKIKTLIEEHGSTKPRFTTDDTDEIKKSDIVNMRQTSMKNRLKSMFDAISGKATSKINPEVVIQAEEKPSSSESIVASLSSTTSTTNVNTSPIATSAIVPIIGKTKPSTTPAKHVTFQFTNNETSLKANVAESPKISTIETKIGGSIESGETKKLENPTVLGKTALTDSIFANFNPSTSSASFSMSAPVFTSPSSVTSSQNSSTIQAQATTTSISTSNPTCVITTTTSAPQFNSQIFSSPTKSSLFQIPAQSLSQSVSSPLSSFATKITDEKNSQSATNFSFITPKTATLTPSTQNISPKTTQTPEISVSQTVSSASSSLPSVTSVSSSGLFGFGVTTKPSGGDSASFGFPRNRPIAFGASCQPTEKKDFTFGTPTASSSTIFQTPETTSSSQTGSNSATVATTSTGSGFNFSTANPLTTMLFGTSSSASIAPSSSGFSSSTSTAPGFTFGTNPTSAATTKTGFSFTTSPETTLTAATTSSNVPALSFGNTNNNNNNNTDIPVFGGSSTTSSSTTTQQNIFGTSLTTTSAMTTQPSIFGTPATTSAQITQPSIFGAPATTSTVFPASTISSAFGTTSSLSSTTFSATSSAPTTFGTPKTMETPTFGCNTVASPSFVATPTTTSLFGTVNTEATASTSIALPSFGNSGFGQKPPPAFSTSVSTSNFSTGTGNASSLFDTQPTEPFGGTSSSGPRPVYGFSNASTPSFGTPSTTQATFGSTNTSTTSFGATTTATPVFGTISTTAPNFGVPNSGTAATIGNPNATNNTFNTTFGVTTTAPPAFPTSITPSSSGFGSSSTTTGFGTSNNPPPAFSSNTPSFTSFGAASNSTSPFGTQPTTGNSTFGSTNSANTGFGGNSNNNTAGTSFTFGASQPNVQQPQQNAVFTFGGTPANSTNNPTTGSSAPFQFGASAPQTGGFNFTGAPTAPAINFTKDGASSSTFNLLAPGTNSFSAPPTTGGMFSIGTGSSAPRSRPSRRRQR